MAVTGNRKAADEALNDQLQRPLPASVGRAQARAPKKRMMTVEERMRFIDDIRSRSRETTEDSTDLIRRDRDER